MKTSRAWSLLWIVMLFWLPQASAASDFSFKPYPRISNQPVFAKNGMVSSAHPFASRVGVEILQKGGNAFDAAVATALVLSAVEPWMCGPGGGSFYILWDNKKKEMKALDADSLAPYAATPDKFKDRSELAVGLKSMPIPGSMAGYWELLSKYGTMSFAEVAAPAISYLENGFPMSSSGYSYLGRIPEALILFPNLAANVAPAGEFPKPGQLMKNPNLANTYRIIAKEGIDAFYKGSIAKKMVDYMQANGGLWTMKDLADYKVQWKVPLHAKYRDLDMYGTPPPSSSMTWMQMMKIAENFDFTSIESGSPEAIHLITEIDKLAHSDGYNFVADPDFVKIPTKELLSDNYAKAQSQRVDLQKAAQGRVAPGKPLEWSKTGRADNAEPPRYAAVDHNVNASNMIYTGATTHVAVIDKDGNAISFTHTLGTFFGGNDAMGDTGVVPSNGNDWTDLDTNPWSTTKPSPLVIEPRKRNRWTLAPGIVMKGNKPFILIGGSGGDTTQSGIFQVLLNMLEWKMNPQMAISSPRTIYGDVRHYTGGTSLGVEPELWGTTTKLTEKGHQIVPKEKFPAWTGFRPLVGNIQTIMVDSESGTYAGGAEPRLDGHVNGY